MFWLSRDEVTELVNELFKVLQVRMSNQPAPGLVSYFLFPIEPVINLNDT